MATDFSSIDNDLLEFIILLESKIEIIDNEKENLNNKNFQSKKYNNLLQLLKLYKNYNDDNEISQKINNKIEELIKYLDYKNIEQIISENIRVIEESEIISEEDIDKCIKLIKKEFEITSIESRKEFIKRLNKCIIKKNEINNNGKGIILQLTKYRSDFYISNDIAFALFIQCNNCNYLFKLYGRCDCDIYAPSKCPKCNSYNLNHKLYDKSLKGQHISFYNPSSKYDKLQNNSQPQNNFKIKNLFEKCIIS